MWRPRVLGVVLTGVAMVAVACGPQDATGVGSGGGTSSLPAAPQSSTPGAAALAAAEARWKAKAPASYSFIYEPSCFCPRTKLLVTVVDGDVTSVTAAPGQHDDPNAFVPPVADTPSAETLFADLRRAYSDAKPAADVQVTYDAEYGYPASVFIDWDVNAADEETRYGISALTATPPVDVVGKWLPEKDNGAFITFNGDGTYVGSDGCNGSSGTWSTATGTLAVTTGVHTEIACDNQTIDEWIAKADSVTIAADSMTIATGTTRHVLTRTP